MKSFINLACLCLFFFEMHSIGINIYHQQAVESAMLVYQSFIDKGISPTLISVIERENQCSMTYENSFIDVCIDRKKEMKVIRKTSWLYKSLKPITKERLEE